MFYSPSFSLCSLTSNKCFWLCFCLWKLDSLHKVFLHKEESMSPLLPLETACRKSLFARVTHRQNRYVSNCLFFPCHPVERPDWHLRLTGWIFVNPHRASSLRSMWPARPHFLRKRKSQPDKHRLVYTWSPAWIKHGDNSRNWRPTPSARQTRRGAQTLARMRRYELAAPTQTSQTK